MLLFLPFFIKDCCAARRMHWFLCHNDVLMNTLLIVEKEYKLKESLQFFLWAISESGLSSFLLPATKSRKLFCCVDNNPIRITVRITFEYLEKLLHENIIHKSLSPAAPHPSSREGGREGGISHPPCKQQVSDTWIVFMSNILPLSCAQQSTEVNSSLCTPTVRVVRCGWACPESLQALLGVPSTVQSRCGFGCQKLYRLWSKFR